MLYLESECCICCESFQNPVFLPCQHMFCNKCITEALDISSQCPLCRRVICNLINQTFPTTQIREKVQDQISGIPIFQYKITLSYKEIVDFNFFEPRYVQMITDCLNTNLEFIIHPDFNEFCYKVRIIQCQSLLSKQIYQCSVKCIQRMRVLKKIERNITADKNKLYYVIAEPVIDTITNQCQILFNSIKNIYNELRQLLQFNNEEDQKEMDQLFSDDNEETISEKSLQLLNTIQISENTFQKLFFDTHLQLRLQVILNHFQAILNYHKRNQ